MRGRNIQPVNTKEAGYIYRAKQNWSPLWKATFLPIGPYVVDFICLEQGLVIEVDGSQHDEQAARKHDETRTAYLNQQGFRVIRVWNNDVLGRLNAVLDLIRLSLRQAD
ncbi:endonuclease domain-containing protein [Aeromonas allosaccharophila]|uniref:endonuclease domain-containing protein n=1 Tax=Aeromonas allosaccharophila TaxID=656 RepID=UPI003006E9E6